MSGDVGDFMVGGVWCLLEYAWQSLLLVANEAIHLLYGLNVIVELHAIHQLLGNMKIVRSVKAKDDVAKIRDSSSMTQDVPII